MKFKDFKSVGKTNETRDHVRILTETQAEKLVASTITDIGMAKAAKKMEPSDDAPVVDGYKYIMGHKNVFAFTKKKGPSKSASKDTDEEDDNDDDTNDGLDSDEPEASESM